MNKLDGFPTREHATYNWPSEKTGLADPAMLCYCQISLYIIFLPVYLYLETYLNIQMDHLYVIQNIKFGVHPRK